jgi:hypothetical protein
MVFATGSEFIAERPTGAGLTLGMGLRDIGGEAGRMIQRRRSPAKPDGLGGVMPHLIGLAGFSAECRCFHLIERSQINFESLPLYVNQKLYDKNYTYRGCNICC